MMLTKGSRRCSAAGVSVMDVAAELGKSCSSSKAERATEETLDAGETARSMEAIGTSWQERIQAQEVVDRVV